MVVLASMWKVPLAPSLTQQWYQSPVRRRVRPRQLVRLRRKQQRRYKQVRASAWGGAWWIDGLTLEGECCVQVWVICLTSNKRVKVEHLISKRIHKLIGLRFLVRVWCLSCLCDCSSLNVDGPQSSPQWPNLHNSLRIIFYKIHAIMPPSYPWWERGYVGVIVFS